MGDADKPPLFVEGIGRHAPQRIDDLQDLAGRIEQIFRNRTRLSVIRVLGGAVKYRIFLP